MGRCCAALDRPDGSGDTPMHVAARGGHCAVVEALLRAGGVSFSAPSAQSKTPVDLAADRLSGAVTVQLLLDAGANLPHLQQLSPDVRSMLERRRHPSLLTLMVYKLAQVRRAS